MNNFKKKAIAAAVGSALGLALTSAPAQAAPTYNGCASTTFCTLDELFGGASIVMNGVTFGGFSLGFSSGYVQPFSQVSVTGDDADPLNLGLLYDGFSIIAASSIFSNTAALDYSFTVDSSSTNLLLKDASLSLSSSIPLVEISEDLFDAGDDLLASLYVYNDSDDADLDDSVVYAPTDFLGVDTFIAADASNTGAAWLDNFEQYFSLEEDMEPPPSEAPEPGTLALLGAGLAGIGFSRRRKAKS